MRVGPALISLLACGCTRDPAEAMCPELAEGDLVVTEVGGPQTGNDLLTPWVEVYNASGGSVDLIGTRIRFRRKDGSGEIAVLVRRALVAAAGSYTVLGVGEDAELKPYLDYGFGTDFDQSWLSSAAVDVESCGTRIDRAGYDSLPRTGTYSLGVTPPTADGNDLPASWCTDITNAIPGGFPGTPQQANSACP